MLWNKKHAGIAVTLIICIAFLMFGGVSQVAGETFVPEFIKVIEPEFLEVTEPEFMEVTEFEFMETSEPEFSEPFVDVDGSTKRGGKPTSVEEIMCAPVDGLPTPEKCLFVGQ